jgi:hypothetical protein
MKFLNKVTFLAIFAIMCASVITHACTWEWEQDNCQNVMCPSNCVQSGYGIDVFSKCNDYGYYAGPCCTCWCSLGNTIASP